jgi:cyclophilin family peptidyl-prolyl cis-trans isomerase
VRALTLLAVLAAAGCQRARAPDTPTAARHPELLNPQAEVWRQRAPDTVRVRVETTRGPFVLEAYRAWAPHGVDRLYALVRSGYFDDSRFFRTLPNYIVQFGIAGDPAVARAWQESAIPDDPPTVSNSRGTFGFSMRGPNDRRTQLYINLVDNRRNDADGFALLGHVVEGMDVVDRLYSGYGSRSGGGMRQGQQDSLFASGNAYLDREFPLLDRLIRATLVNVPNASR